MLFCNRASRHQVFLSYGVGSRPGTARVYLGNSSFAHSRHLGAILRSLAPDLALAGRRITEVLFSNLPGFRV